MSHLRFWGKHRTLIATGVWICALLAVLPQTRAQTPAGQAQDRAELLRTTTNLREEPSVEVNAGDSEHAISSPNDPDLGEQAILKRAEHYQAFTFFASAPISYTSNVALVRNGEEDDLLFTPAVGVSFAPRITRTLFANIGFSQQFFYYDRFDGLNFASLDFRAGLVYTIPSAHYLVLRADYDFNRLTTEDLDHEFFRDHALGFGAELPFRIGRAQQVTVGADFSFSVAAHPDAPARHDYSGYVGYSVSLTRALALSAVGRLAVRDYVEGGRTDVSEILAFGASYRINTWLSANAIATFAWNDSNQDVFHYEVANVGGALSLSMRF